MKKTILSTIIISLFSLANGQVFELQENNSKVSNTSTSTNTATVSEPSSEEDEVIVDKSSEEVIVAPQVTPHIDKWMSIVQAKDRDYLLIEKSLQSGQNANQTIFDGSTMLHIAAWQNDEKLFRLGLQYGGMIGNVNKSGETVLHWAAYSNNPNIISLALSDKNALKIINKQNKAGRTALHFNALKWGNLEVAKILINNKADLNIKDNNGQTPLHYALALRKWNLAKLYIDYGADINIKDKDNEGIDEYLLTQGDIEGFITLYKYVSPATQEIIKTRLNNLHLNL